MLGFFMSNFVHVLLSEELFFLIITHEDKDLRQFSNLRGLNNLKQTSSKVVSVDFKLFFFGVELRKVKRIKVFGQFRGVMLGHL